jgi:hypothetical protein
MPRFSVYQLGRGSDPVIVVGSIFPAVAVNMSSLSLRVKESDPTSRLSGTAPLGPAIGREQDSKSL